MPLSVGTRLGNYEIVGLLGKGGMGEVYRGKDTKLARDVAIKVLPAAFAQHPERLARFEREARVLASLNHPNIATIYAVEETSDGKALVMELVEGATLKVPLVLDEALRIAGQVAEALEAAHDKGITHRDLKPANIMITPAGVVKVLDFGLAAISQPGAGSENPANSPTLTMGATQAGVIMGTAAYMSPEQAVGKPVDKRADIWSFGVVLLETLTGKTLFHGETISHVLADVIRADIDFNKLPATTPPAIRNLLKRCLDRDVKTRLRDIGEARVVIQRYLANPTEVEQVPDLPSQAGGVRHKWLWPGVSAVFLAAAAALGFVAFRHVTEESRTVKLFLPAPEKTTFTSTPAVSPDGRRLAFAAEGDGKNELWVRDLDSLAARPLPGTEGATYPFWSPDSRVLGFFASGKLKRIDVAGGPALTLGDAPGARGGSWSKNGAIVFSANFLSGLLRVPAAGGSVTPATTLDEASGENAHRMPWFLPDGRHFLYTARNNDAAKNTVYVADLEFQDRLRNRHAVLVASSNAVYAPPGYLLFLRDGTLMAQPFDAGKLQTSGDAAPVAEKIDFDALNIVGRFSASQSSEPSSVLAYSTGGAGGTQQLAWMDRSGKALGTMGPAGDLISGVISPDGNTVAFDRRDSQTGFYDVWLHELKRGTDSRFTFNSKSNQYPVWAPDGSHIAFRSTRDGALGNLYQKAVGATAQEDALDKSPQNKRPDDWSRDGRYIIEETGPNAGTGYDIWVLPLIPDKSGERKPFSYLKTEFNERFAKLSPDGRWLAYSSDETKRFEVYVQTFPTPGGQQQISINGGTRPVWSRDGKELFFIGLDDKMMAVAIKSGAKLEAGVPKPLIDARFPIQLAWFDVDKNGRFLIPASGDLVVNVPMTVLVNWTVGLKK
jgi:serine/threonine protein kinase/Tol biopolymer transport system component